MQFEIPIEETRGKRSYIVSLHLVVCFLLIVTGIFELLLNFFFSKPAADKFAHFTLLKWEGILTTILGFGLLGFLIFKNKWLNNSKINRVVRIVEFIIFISFAITALQIQVIYPAIIFALVAACLLFAIIWETKAENRKVIINEEGISTPKASGNQLLKWHEIQHIIYKFGIITVDCVDNRLLQWNTKAFSFDEELFADFCKAKIAAAVKGRNKSW